MVNINAVRESNAALHNHVTNQVSLFVGATSGIALHTLLEYTRRSIRPKIYIVGRNETRLSDIIQDLENLNSEGTYIPIKSEISLLKNVDIACAEIKGKEERLDLLIMCPGYLKWTRVGKCYRQ